MRRPEGRGYFTSRQPTLLFLLGAKVSASSFIDGIIESHVLRLQRNRQDVLCMEPVGEGDSWVRAAVMSEGQNSHLSWDRARDGRPQVCR